MRSREQLSRAMAGCVKLLANRRLLGYAGAGGFFCAGMFAYVAGPPFAFITYYHIPARFYGLLFGLGIPGIMAANILNSRLVQRFGYERLLLAGTVVAACSAVMVAVAARMGFGGLLGLGVPLFFFVSATGFIVANSIAGALSDFPDRSGTVSALIGAVQYGSGIVGSVLVGAFADGLAPGLGDRGIRDRKPSFHGPARPGTKSCPSSGGNPLNFIQRFPGPLITVRPCRPDDNKEKSNERNLKSIYGLLSSRSGTITV